MGETTKLHEPVLLRGFFDTEAIRGITEITGQILTSDGEAFRRRDTGVAKYDIGSFFILNDHNSRIVKLCNKLVMWFWRTALPGNFKGIYDDDPVLAVSFCTIRRHKPDDFTSHVAWHYDANFSGWGCPFHTYWVPLSEVGHKAPGLEFCVELEPKTSREIQDRWMRVPKIDGRKVVEDHQLDEYFEAAGYKIVSWPMTPGDVVCFSHEVLHRTQRMKHASRERVALEFRVFSKQRPIPELNTLKMSKVGVGSMVRSDGQVVIDLLHRLFPD